MHLSAADCVRELRPGQEYPVKNERTAESQESAYREWLIARVKGREVV